MKTNSTGYFGRPSPVPGGTGISTNVHYVGADGKPVCGYKPHKTMEFQWCSDGLNFQYLECKGCKEWAKNREKSKINKDTDKEITMSDKTIKIGPKVVEKDITIELPNGEEVVVQYRAYDEESGPSLDIILPKPMPINCYRGSEMKPAKAVGKSGNVRNGDQITLIF